MFAVVAEVEVTVNADKGNSKMSSDVQYNKGLTSNPDLYRGHF